MDDNKFDLILRQEAEKDRPFHSARKPSGFSRQEVVDALQHAFRMIGGVQRLALWADQNTTEFYRLYTKLLPSSAINLEINNEVIIQHAIPPSKLDEHPGFASPNVVKFPDKKNGTDS
jgi:hypothetical protein